VVLDVVPLNMCGVVFGIPHMYMRNTIFIRRENQYRLIKDGNSYIINAHKFKFKISLASSNQAKMLNSSSKQYVLLKRKSVWLCVNKSKRIPGGEY